MSVYHAFQFREPVAFSTYTRISHDFHEFLHLVVIGIERAVGTNFKMMIPTATRQAIFKHVQMVIDAGSKTCLPNTRGDKLT